MNNSAYLNDSNKETGTSCHSGCCAKDVADQGTGLRKIEGMLFHLAVHWCNPI